MSDLPHGQVRITDQGLDRNYHGRQQFAEVWVDGKAVAKLPVTAASFEAGIGGLPKVKLELIGDGGAFDTRRDQKSRTESVSIQIRGDASAIARGVASAQASLDTFTRGPALARRINSLESDDGPNHFRGERG